MQQRTALQSKRSCAPFSSGKQQTRFAAKRNVVTQASADPLLLRVARGEGGLENPTLLACSSCGASLSYIVIDMQ
jgi:hypothetical protein